MISSSELPAISTSIKPEKIPPFLENDTRPSETGRLGKFGVGT